MSVSGVLEQFSAFWSPLTFAALLVFSVIFLWMAFRPAGPKKDVRTRLNAYLDRGDIVVDEDLQKPFVSRAIWPSVRSLLRFFSRLMPQRDLEATRLKLQQAGNPMELSAIDFYGVRVLAILFLGGFIFLLSLQRQELLIALRNALIGGVIGYLLPVYWLRTKVRSRKHKIQRALPDALDMLTIAVEAGLAFETAMVRVGEKWNNALSFEFRRAVAEMRVGMTREEALTRMATRCGVPELETFVAVLIQSSQLGVSIAQVLHVQAAEMRMKRRQRAEELARQAGIKMVFPLALFILPALFVVILGPLIPQIMKILGALGGNASRSGF
jgi:tight adherence protein C